MSWNKAGYTGLFSNSGVCSLQVRTAGTYNTRKSVFYITQEVILILLTLNLMKSMMCIYGKRGKNM